MFAWLDDHAHEDTDTLVRGLVWLLAADPGGPATDLLARVAVAAGSAQSRSSGFPFAARAAAAAVEALAERPGEAPPRALARLVLSVRNKGLRARVQTALDRASAHRGWAPGEAAELAVDDHGLGPAGVRSFPQSDGLVLEVIIDGDKPRLRASRHGKPLKGVPSGVDASEPLAEVPSLVFGEAMRDVDLFVGVTSIAADEAWADRGEHRFHAYWERASLGELSGSATVRRDVLGRLLPRLTIGPQCEVTDRFLRVRGIYRIHLGLGNILIEPDDRYLCIVPDRGAAARQSAAALPFEDDHMLSVILSKAIMLADDDRITDPTILQQLPGIQQLPR